MHLIKELQRQLPAPALLARADKAAVCDHVPLAAALSHLAPRLQRPVQLPALAIGAAIGGGGTVREVPSVRLQQLN